MRASFSVLAATVLLVAGCSAASTGGSAAPSAPSIKSASGTIVGSIVVLKNNFFSDYREQCGDWSITGSTSDFVTYGECPGTPAYFWLFDSPAQRDAYMSKIREKKLPLLVSDTWVIASSLNLEAAQRDIGGAINP
ncbi:hypothetical protein [Arthrobacter methylotrophus]|uniref:Lipoprotein n=1 Tax=Arthrobacter methylotrophus TaxID=121291 RepID=A0ABV5UQS7_9MICC